MVLVSAAALMVAEGDGAVPMMQLPPPRPGEKANGCGRARDKGVDRLVARAALIWGACRHQTDQVELRVIDDESDLGNPRRIAREEVCDDRSEAPGALKV